MPCSKETAAAAGRRGGLATLARYGRSYLQTIGRRGFRATTRVLERPGQGAVGYDRRAWLLGKLFPDQYRRGAPHHCLICKTSELAHVDAQAGVAFCAHHAPRRNPRVP
jgi:hypothetical protein